MRRSQLVSQSLHVGLVFASNTNPSFFSCKVLDRGLESFREFRSTTTNGPLDSHVTKRGSTRMQRSWPGQMSDGIHFIIIRRILSKISGQQQFRRKYRARERHHSSRVSYVPSGNPARLEGNLDATVHHYHWSTKRVYRSL